MALLEQCLEHGECSPKMLSQSPYFSKRTFVDWLQKCVIFLSLCVYMPCAMNLSFQKIETLLPILELGLALWLALVNRTWWRWRCVISNLTQKAMWTFALSWIPYLCMGTSPDYPAGGKDTMTPQLGVSQPRSYAAEWPCKGSWRHREAQPAKPTRIACLNPA